MKIPKLTFSAVLFAFQFILLFIYGALVDYEKYDAVGGAIPSYYPEFQDVHVMIFIGFGFLMTFLKKYGYSAAGYNLLISAVVIQWAMVVSSWMAQASDGKPNPEKVKLGVKNLITSDFTAGAVMISFGAVLGKASRLQLILMGIFEVVFFAFNETVLVHYLVVSDVGGSLVIHLFGCYFGLAVAFVLKRQSTTGEENSKEGPSTTSDMFSLIGTIFLWMFWPSFNGAMLGPGDQQQRAIVNTYIALASCCVSTFALSPLCTKKFKLNMVHVQNATLAGGVAVGALANLQIKPWGAMLIGIISGVISTLGYDYVTPLLRKKIGLHDTCGVHNLHGMPAIFSGIAACVAASVAKIEDYGSDLYSIWSARAPKNGTAAFTRMALQYSVPTNGKDRSKSTQAAMQFAALVCSLAISIIGGLITGAIVKFLDNPTDDQLYDDEDFWEVPEEEGSVVIANINGNEIGMTMKQTTEQL